MGVARPVQHPLVVEPHSSSSLESTVSCQLPVEINASIDFATAETVGTQARRPARRINRQQSGTPFYPAKVRKYPSNDYFSPENPEKVLLKRNKIER